jgi:hypothetical protein
MNRHEVSRLGITLGDGPTPGIEVRLGKVVLAAA